MNRQIVISAVVIVAAGAYHLYVGTSNNKTTLTRIVIGGYLLALIASAFDLVGGPFTRVLGAIMVLAAGTAAATVLPDLASRIQGRK